MLDRKKNYAINFPTSSRKRKDILETFPPHQYCSLLLSDNSYCSLAEVTIVNMCTFFKSRVPTIQHCIEMMVLQQAYTFCPSELLSDY